MEAISYFGSFQLLLKMFDKREESNRNLDNYRSTLVKFRKYFPEFLRGFLSESIKKIDNTILNMVGSKNNHCNL